MGKEKNKDLEGGENGKKEEKKRILHLNADSPFRKGSAADHDF